MKNDSTCEKADEFCCKGVFDGQKYTVRLEAELSVEMYRSHTAAREFVPLTVREGTRTKVEASFSTPDRFLTAAKSARAARIGNGQAWLYHEDQILLFWRCNLLDSYRAIDPVADENLHALWEGFEHFLLKRFPTTRQLLTPAWNRPYDQSRWLQFIRMHGFTRPSPVGIQEAAFIKDMVSKP